MKYLLVLMLPLLAACSGEVYRYPCQDPTNWDKQICKKPFCSANGTCPEDLTNYEKTNHNSQSASQSRKGECK